MKVPVIDLAADNWGWNPAALEAWATLAAGVFAFAAFVIALLSWRAAKKQTDTVEGEIASRMRPWVGLFGFEFTHGAGGAKPRLDILLKNFGPLPAHRAHLTIVIEPQDALNHEKDNPVVHKEPYEDKALMPEEDGNYGFPVERYPLLAQWVSAERDLLIDGCFTYAHAGREFKSLFQAKIWLRQERSPDGQVKTNWRNVTVT